MMLKSPLVNVNKSAVNFSGKTSATSIMVWAYNRNFDQNYLCSKS